MGGDLAPRGADVPNTLRALNERCISKSGNAISLQTFRDIYLQDFESAGGTGATQYWDEPVYEMRAALEVAWRADRRNFTCLEWDFGQPDADDIVGEDTSGNMNLPRATGDVASEPFALGRNAIMLSTSTSGIIAVPSPSLDVGAANRDFTVTMFVRLLRSAEGEWRSLLYKGRYDQDRTFSIWFRFDSNRLHARVSTDAYWNEGIESSRSEVPLGRWTHIAYVKAGNQLRLFLDGDPDGAVTLRGKIKTNPGPLYIGASPWYPGPIANIADVRIYPFALSESSIQGLARRPNAARRAATSLMQDYYSEIYQTILAARGISHEYLLSCAIADDTARANAAVALGIQLNEMRPDGLDRMTLTPGRISAAELLAAFGFAANPSDSLVAISNGRANIDADLYRVIDRRTLPLLRTAVLAQLADPAIVEDLIRELRDALAIDIPDQMEDTTTRRNYASQTLSRISNRIEVGDIPRGASHSGWTASSELAMKS